MNYLNGKPIDKLPPEAVAIMSERLSRVMSQHLREHPEELPAFQALDIRNRKKQEKDI